MLDPSGFLSLTGFPVRADVVQHQVTGSTKETRRACPEAAEGVCMYANHIRLDTANGIFAESVLRYNQP